jgi:nitrite reductase/ring-hydroxylating ferredoxin subunit
MSGLEGIDAGAPEGTIAAAVVDGRPVAVIRHADGWVQVPDRCTHAACPFTRDSEVVDGTTLICNCHGSEYDLRTGEVMLGPAEEPLAVVRLVVEAGVLRPAG